MNGVVPFANVVNKKTKMGAQSNYEGFYTILVAPNDSIVVSAIGFSKSTFVVPSGIFASSFYFDVLLQQTTTILDTSYVYVINWDKFKTDFEAMGILETKNPVRIDKSAITSKAPVRTAPGISLNGPFSWLYNKFSKRQKELEKLEEIRNGEIEYYKAQERLTTEFIVSATGLPEVYVNDFITYCNVSTSALANFSDYDLIVTYQKCLENYKLDRNLSDEDIKNKVLPKVGDNNENDTIK